MRPELIVIASVALSGCASALTAAVGNPRPNVALFSQSGKSMRLAITESVVDELALWDPPGNLDSDTYAIPGHDPHASSEPDYKVSGWRTTLKNGFENGLRDYFKLVPISSPADFTLEVMRAELQFLRRPRHGISVVLTYKARLVSGAGTTLGVAAGTVASKPSMLPVDAYDGDLTPVVTSAAESMYEELTEKLLRFPADGASAPSTHNGS
jgi:hypothetical protein